MKSGPGLLVAVISTVLCGLTFSTSAQDLESNKDVLKNTNNAVDQTIERHPWEVNINVVPLLKLAVQSNWGYVYLIKRNVGKDKHLGAWRFMVNPHLINKNQKVGDPAFTTSNPKTTYFVPSTLIGYEFQKVRGRFTFYYGADLGSRIQLNNTRDDDAIFQPDS